MRVTFLVVSLLAAPAVLAAPAAPGSTATSGAAASSGPAATSTGGPAPSKQGLELSRALVPEQTWNRLLDRSAAALSSAVSRSLSARGEKVPSDLESTIRKELGKSMKYQQALTTQAQALEKRFTPSELQQAAKFYESPLGKKMLTQLPAAQSEVGDQLQERLATVVPDIIHRVAPSAMAGSGPGGLPPPGAGGATAPTGTGGGAAAGSEGPSGASGAHP